MTRASVIVPSHRGAARLPRLLASLKEQTHPDFEVVVVVDGVLDDTPDVLDQFEGIDIRRIVFSQNRGRVTALNAGFSNATGDVLIRADDDFEPSPGHVSAHVKAHESGPCGAIGLPLNVAPGTPYMRVYGADADERGRRAAYAVASHERWRLWGGNTSVTRPVFDQVGGFDLRYRGYGWEDLDFGYRIHRLGLPLVLLPDAEVRHHLASIDTRTRVDRAFSSGRAQRQFEEIHGAGTSSSDDSTSAWRWATDLASRGLDKSRASAAAGAVDRALPWLPPALGRKAVAFVVESAATAGFSHRAGSGV